VLIFQTYVTTVQVICLRSMQGFHFNLQLLQITVIYVLYYTTIYMENRVEDPDVNSKDTT